ncbi:MAG: APC family permease [Pirellulaceae bacterium]
MPSISRVPETPPAAQPKQQLGLFDAACIIVGIIIGSGIYRTTPLIAANVGSAEQLIAVWLLGGFIALLGAMCYAELTTTYPKEGGDYVYLTRAFGRQTGFLFAWAEYWIVRPGNVGMMAFVFATFAYGLLPMAASSPADGVTAATVWQVALAAGSVAVLTLINVFGVQTGKTTQNVLATLKVVGLFAIVVVGLFLSPAAATTPPGTGQGGNFRFALILVLFTYGGWNEISYVAAEVRRPERNLFWALLLGLAAVTFLYVCVNLAFVRSLGLAGTASSSQVASDVFRLSYGEWGAKAMNVLVCVSALGAINGMLFTGARIYYAVGSDHHSVAWLGKWSGRLDSPVRALVLQGVISVLLIAGFGWYQDGFERLTLFTTPVYWLFAMMVGISLMILRWRDRDQRRPHKVWFYPWTPLFFCVTCAVLCESSLMYAVSQQRWEALWAICLMLVGVFVSMLFDSHRDLPEEK